MEEKVLILNLSDQEDSDFQNKVSKFLSEANKGFIAVSKFSDFDENIFKRDPILKVILYFDLSDTSEEELIRRLILLNQSYAPFHEQVYIRDNDQGSIKKVLKTNFLYTHLYSEDQLLPHLQEVFEEEQLVDMAEPELYPIWQDILNGILVAKPERIEELSTDTNSVYMRGILYLRKGNRRTAFELFKNLFMNHQKYFPVIEILKEFDDMKDQLPMEYYLNYKLFNKIKQGKVNYLKEEKEKKTKKKSKFKGVPNKDKISRSKFQGVPNEDKTLKKFKLNYKDFEDLRGQLAKYKKLNMEELRDLNEEANNLSRQERYEEAVVVYKKIYKHIEKDKRYKILLNIAIAYKRGKKWKLSLHYAKETLKQDPSNAKAIELVDYCKEMSKSQSA